MCINNQRLDWMHTWTKYLCTTNNSYVQRIIGWSKRTLKSKIIKINYWISNLKAVALLKLEPSLDLVCSACHDRLDSNPNLPFLSLNSQYKLYNNYSKSPIASVTINARPVFFAIFCFSLSSTLAFSCCCGWLCQWSAISGLSAS